MRDKSKNNESFENGIIIIGVFLIIIGIILSIICLGYQFPFILFVIGLVFIFIGYTLCNFRFKKRKK